MAFGALPSEADPGSLSFGTRAEFGAQEPKPQDEKKAQDEKKTDDAKADDKKSDDKDKKDESAKKEESAKSSAKESSSKDKKSDKDKKDKDKDALKRPKLTPAHGESLLVHANKVIERPGVELLDADVLIRGGVIVGVGKGLAAPEGARKLEADVVCAGFLDPWSTVGLEAESASTFQSTSDSRTTDALDPFTDPHLRRQAMRGGVTSARVQAAGTSQIGGLGAVVRLDFLTATETTPSSRDTAAAPASESHASSDKVADKAETDKADTDKSKSKKDDADSKEGAESKHSDAKPDAKKEADSKHDAAATPAESSAPVLAPPFGEAVLNDAASLAASIGIPRQGNLDPFDRINEVERLAAALDAGRRYNEARAAYATDLAEWEKKIAEKEKELEKDFKKAKKDRDKELKDAKEKDKEFKEKAYKEDKRPTAPSASPEDAAMALAANGEVPLVVEVHRAAEIRALLDMLHDHPRVRLVLAGATEAASLAADLAAAHVTVIVYPAPLGRDRAAGWVEHDLGLAGALADAGVDVLIGSGGSSTATRDLSMLAGIAIGHGLSPERAFDALTLRAAQVFDVADRVGSVEVGKQADLLLLRGEPLSPTSRVQYVLIGGRVVLEPESR